MSAPKPSEKFDLEAVYDAELAPLMAKIIEICKRNELPMFASFALSDNGLLADAHDTRFCTTHIAFDDRRVPVLELCVRVVKGNAPTDSPAFDARLERLMPNPTSVVAVDMAKGQSSLVAPTGLGALLSGQGEQLAVGDHFTLTALSKAFECFRVLSAIHDELTDLLAAAERRDAAAVNASVLALIAGARVAAQRAIRAVPAPPETTPDGQVH